MLSRTADSLYWLARYVERAENIARIVTVGYRMASLASSLGNQGNEWQSTLVAAGCESGFFAKYKEAESAAVIDYLVRDPDNTSSIMSCFETARSNARMVRCGAMGVPCLEVSADGIGVRRVCSMEWVPGRECWSARWRWL